MRLAGADLGRVPHVDEGGPCLLGILHRAGRHQHGKEGDSGDDRCADGRIHQPYERAVGAGA